MFKPKKEQNSEDNHINNSTNLDIKENNSINN